MTDQVTDAQAAAGAAAPNSDDPNATKTGADNGAAGGTPAGGADAGAAAAQPAGDGAGTAAQGDDAKPAGDAKPTPPRGEDGKFLSWREQVAGTDAKLLERLKRFKDPADVAKAWIEADKKINAGLKPVALAKDATPEQVTEWRKANGIPETAEGYDLSNLRDGLVVGEADKPILAEILKGAHGRNMAPEQVRGIVEDYFALREKEAAAQQAKDDATVTETQGVLRAEWGAHYERNLNVLNAYIEDTWGADAELFKSARLADGTPLLAHPLAVKQIFAEAFERNPQATLTGGAAGAASAADDEIIARAEKLMRDDRKAYDRDQKLQDSYLAALRRQENRDHRKVT